MQERLVSLSARSSFPRSWGWRARRVSRTSLCPFLTLTAARIPTIIVACNSRCRIRWAWWRLKYRVSPGESHCVTPTAQDILHLHEWNLLWRKTHQTPTLNKQHQQLPSAPQGHLSTEENYTTLLQISATSGCLTSEWMLSLFRPTLIKV